MTKQFVIQCEVCWNEFTASQSNRKTCSEHCRTIYKQLYDMRREKKNKTERYNYINEKNKERYWKKRLEYLKWIDKADLKLLWKKTQEKLVEAWLLEVD